MEKDIKKFEEKVELVEVPTQTAIKFKLPTGEIVDYDGYLLWLGNLVYIINKKTG